MIKTGYISFLTESGGGQDADGNPVAATKVNSDYIFCNLNTLTKEYRLLVDGQYLAASFSCYIDSDKISSLIPVIDLQTITEVQIQDNNENDLGIYQVMNVEYLNLTKRVKIIV